ncbi:MAG: zinc ribbon domain-containing protein [Rivularia sp. (in: cyanobacteria)]
MNSGSRSLSDRTFRYAGKVVLVERFYPSTKKCSNCGKIKEISLSERIYVCEKCHHTQDRDLNAGENLDNYARLARAVPGR